MFVTAMVASALMAGPMMDKWEIKPNLAPKTKSSWVVGVDAQTPDGDHRAEFTLVREMGEKDGEARKVSMGWHHLLVDGAEMPDEILWPVTVDTRGAVVGTTAEEGDDIRRMLSALTFAYPDKAVGDGDKWSVEVRPSKGKDDLMLTYAYEVKGMEAVDKVDALKVFLTLEEKGTDGMRGEGIWWVAKDGTILQFEMKMKNWVVPMAGGQPFDAFIKGKKS